MNICSLFSREAIRPGDGLVKISERSLNDPTRPITVAGTTRVSSCSFYATKKNPVSSLARFDW